MFNSTCILVVFSNPLSLCGFFNDFKYTNINTRQWLFTMDGDCIYNNELTLVIYLTCENHPNYYNCLAGKYDYIYIDEKIDKELILPLKQCLQLHNEQPTTMETHSILLKITQFIQSCYVKNYNSITMRDV